MFLRGLFCISFIGITVGACGGHKSDTLFLDYALNQGADSWREKRRVSAYDDNGVRLSGADAGEVEIDAGHHKKDGAEICSAPDAALCFGDSGANDDLAELGGDGFADPDELDDDIFDEILDDIDPNIDDELSDD
ncbi:MAG: hypothetical protein AAGA09_00940 [Pseudomonadota bacterium]